MVRYVREFGLGTMAGEPTIFYGKKNELMISIIGAGLFRWGVESSSFECDRCGRLAITGVDLYDR